MQHVEAQDRQRQRLYSDDPGRCNQLKKKLTIHCVKIDPLYTVDSELNSLKIKSLINESLKNRDAEIMDLKIKMNDTVLPAIHRHNEAIGQVEIQIKNLDAKFDGGLKMLSGQIQSFDDKLTNIESRVEKR